MSKKYFHEELRKAVDTSGHTTESLAKLTGRHRATVIRWLTGTATPNDIILRQLGQELCGDPFKFLQPDMIYPNGTSRL